MGSPVRAVGTSTRRSTDAGASKAPSWIELIPIAAAVVVLSIGATAMVLAWFGLYRIWLALPIGAAAAGIGLRVLVRVPRWHSPRAAVRAAVVVLVIASAYVALAGVATSEHLYVDRDPAVYNNTAAWVSETGSLLVDDMPPPLRSADLHLESAGAYSSDGHLEFQFAHLTGSFLAVVLDLGGPWLMFRMSAIVMGLGLLAVYVIAVRCVRDVWAAVLAPAILACAMPTLAVARDTFSEPYALLMLWASATLLIQARECDDTRAALLGGLLLAGVFVARVDGALYLIPAIPLIRLGDQPPPTSRVPGAFSRWAFAGLCAGCLLAVIDLVAFSTGYLDNVGGEMRLLFVLTVVSALATLVVPRLGRRLAGDEPWWRSAERLALRTAVPVLTLGVVFLWWIRPVVSTVRVPSAQYLVEQLQRREGVAVDPTRNYAEESVVRLAWYLGPVGLGIAVIGLLLTVHQLVRRPSARPAAWVVVSVLLIGSGYFWRPSLNPDHVWTMRRFVPAVLPALAVLAAAAVARVRSTRHLAAWQRHALAGAMSAILLIPPLIATWPVGQQREQYGARDAVDDTCDLIGSNAAVVVLGAEPATRIPMTLRAWCQVPVAGLTAGVDSQRLGELAGELAAAGHPLVAVTTERPSADQFSAVLSNERTSRLAVNDRQLEKTITRRPSEYIVERFQFWVFDVVPAAQSG